MRACMCVHGGAPHHTQMPIHVRVCEFLWITAKPIQPNMNEFFVVRPCHARPYHHLIDMYMWYCCDAMNKVEWNLSATQSPPLPFTFSSTTHFIHSKRSIWTTTTAFSAPIQPTCRICIHTLHSHAHIRAHMYMGIDGAPGKHEHQF